MNRTTIELKVIRDVCLGYDVYRGSAPAKDIVKAAWIDFHDPEQNPYGYQRDFDTNRSQKARVYAEESEKPFWSEAILAIREDEDVEDDEIVEWCYQSQADTDDKYGRLSVSYTEGLTSNINGKYEPWRRAFSQVDCQHRLGSMANSNELVTFCIIPGINRNEEAKIFRAINQNQKGIPTSLVDTIIHLTDPDVPAEISWAWDLSFDVDSPFRKRVDTGGRGQQDTLINFRGLQQSLKLLVPPKHIKSGALDSEQGYLFARNFWKVVQEEWSTEFEDKDNYKMMVNPGVRALSRIGRRVFESRLDAQDFKRDPIEKYLRTGKKKVNWSATGPLQDATGKGAEKRVFELLVEWFGMPN